MKGRLAFIVLLAIMVSACGGTESLPTIGPSSVSTPIPPVLKQGTLWSDLPPLSEEAKNFIIQNNIQWVYPGGDAGAVKRWDSFPIPIYASPDFRAQDLVSAVNLWQSASNGKITFQIVSSSAEAKIVLDTQWPPPDFGNPSAGACGVGAPRMAKGNAIIFGLGHYAFKVKGDLCDVNVNKSIDLAHEIGHIVLSTHGHTPSGTDVMSSPSFIWKMSPFLSEVTNWLYSVPPGTRPK